MAHRTDPAAVVVDQENLIQGVAKHFLQKVYGPEGMPWGTKFSNWRNSPRRSVRRSRGA